MNEWRYFLEYSSGVITPNYTYGNYSTNENKWEMIWEMIVCTTVEHISMKQLEVILYF